MDFHDSFSTLATRPARERNMWKNSPLANASGYQQMVWYGPLFGIGKACVAMLFCLFMFSTAAIGDEYGTATFTPEQFVEYEQQLNAILKTRRDEEKEFVNQVVRQVRLGKIPSKLVSTSYGWVRNKRPNTNYPFIYFEKVLRLQAKTVKLEKEIPRFDLTIYRSAGQATGRKTYSAGQRTESQRQVKPSQGRR